MAKSVLTFVHDNVRGTKSKFHPKEFRSRFLEEGTNCKNASFLKEF
jgi:hypothetical protein